jgi:hypothetical protein
MVFHAVVMDYNKMKDDYMQNLYNSDDNNKESYRMRVLVDNNIDRVMYNLNYTLMDEKFVEQDNMEWLVRCLIIEILLFR